MEIEKIINKAIEEAQPPPLEIQKNFNELNNFILAVYKMKSKRITQKSKCLCNVCGAEFIIVPQKKNFPDGIEISYFVCSECGEKYVYLVTNAELRKQIKSRGCRGSTADMKLLADELKKKYSDRIKEFEHESKI